MRTTKGELIALESGLGRVLAEDVLTFDRKDTIAKEGDTLNAERIGWLFIAGVRAVKVGVCRCRHLYHPEGECV